ncbi:MAG: serine protease [Desulfobulbaceae bacterium]|nr:MAG: serine protease [Desulfobulbaceae bacterium]
MSLFLVLICCLVAAVSAQAALAQDRPASAALRLEIRGAIGPAAAEYVKEGLTIAEQSGAHLVILEMDTPGGLDTAMRQIIKAVLASPIPVVGYVAPAGSRAASAGTYILYASHVAAMAPATNLGAATPLRITPLPGTSDEGKGDDNSGDEQEIAGSSVLERKMVNDAEAYIKGLAKRHGRNAEWAARAVRQAVSLSAAEALALGVVDLVADGPEDLLAQLDGHEVALSSGPQKLVTRGMLVETLAPSWRIRLLMVITDPNIAYFLLLVGIYGLIFELTHPGLVLPGVAGAVSLLLALYAFQVLPVNYAGLALMLLGIMFMIAEAFVPSFGALGVGGIVAFVSGSLILMNDEGVRISRPLIAATALTSAAVLMLFVGRFYKTSRRPLVSGAEGLLGSVGEAMESFDGKGRIWIHGESWQALSRTPVAKGQQVRVTGQEGLTLNVEILKEEE